MARNRILVAPLDWGLGHATRCIPIIEQLLRSGQEVVLGGSGNALHLLQKAFPNLPVLDLPGYQVRYGSGREQIPVLLRQLPRLLAVIREEHRILATSIPALGIHAVISDNRYGLWSSRIPSVVVCHQLSIALPPALAGFHRALYLLHRHFLRRFDACWVPDFPKMDPLSGDLAHRYPPGEEVAFVGPLSRFAHIGPVADAFSYPELADARPDVVAVLSGPEPQRTLLEALLLKQAADYAGSVWIVQGLAQERRVSVVGRIRLISFMETRDLHRLYKEAPIVISRPGYSSLMDFRALGLKQMILIPTPGQTEQEYLAGELTRKGIAPGFEQHTFQLEEAIEQVSRYTGFDSPNEENADLLARHIAAWLEQLG